MYGRKEDAMPRYCEDVIVSYLFLYSIAQVGVFMSFGVCICVLYVDIYPSCAGRR